MDTALAIPIDDIDLDLANPRIKHFLEMYPILNHEQMLLALGAGAEDEDTVTALGTYNRLKHSIRASRGIIQSIIVKPIDGGRYLCIEGNTRVAIYRELREAARNSGESGKEWNTIPALIRHQMDEEEEHKIRLQVHLVGNRPWDPYSKGKYLYELRDHYKMPLEDLVSYYGGSKSEVLEYINAYLDMEAHYRPLVEDEFDPHRFSSFAQLQKRGIKQALYAANFDEGDFSRWVDERKIRPQNAVRQLPRILGNTQAREIFLRDGAPEAINYLNAPDLDKTLKEATITQLANALQEKIGLLSYDDAKEIATDVDSEEHLDLRDLSTTIRDLLSIGGDFSE